MATAWFAAEPGTNWWQVDLGRDQPIRFLRIDFAPGTEDAGYKIQTSGDGQIWTTAVAQAPRRNRPRWQRPEPAAFHPLSVDARYVRIEFTENPGGGRVGIREFGAFPIRSEPEYYDVTYKYRLRWNDVIYEPGELKVVASKGSQPVGEATMRTAGPPTEIRLAADRTELKANGEDLSYILVEACDRDGTPCPLADDVVDFAIKGPAEIAGVGNGNPLSTEPFQANSRQLFFGKAMLIVRTLESQPGDVRVIASSIGMRSATVTLRSLRQDQ
jgi:hypothetical protein